MLRVPIETQPFRPGTPEVLFEGAYYANGFFRTYDLAPNGERFVAVSMASASATIPAQQNFSYERGQAEIILVQNWFEELKRIVPTK